MNANSKHLANIVLIVHILTSCQGKKNNKDASAAPLPPPSSLGMENSCVADNSCIDSSKDFELGETVPSSTPKTVSIGQKDDISRSGEVVARGIDETKTLYGADRVISWDGLDFVTQQNSTLKRKQPSVILQAFNMNYIFIENQLTQLHQAGYKIIQISPPQQSLERYGIWWESYQPIDNRVFENKFGTENQLRSLIRSAHALGMKVIADTVLNHMADPQRYQSGPLLTYSDLYKPEDFLNHDLYIDLQNYKVKILEAPLDEWRYFYSPERSLYTRFQGFLQKRGKDINSVLKDHNLLTAYEIMFIKEQLPWMYSDLKRLTTQEGVTITFEDDEAICSQRDRRTPCLQSGDFMKQWRNLFGSGALIVRSYYFELTAHTFPIYDNEWDNMEKVAVKWFPGLPSLDKNNIYVKQTHVDLLEKMLRLGIDGFRLDAAKHIPKDYFADLMIDLKTRLQNSSHIVDGELLQEKALFVYGEMATSKVEIANTYRNRMEVTDFFMLDTFIYSTVFKESYDTYGRGEENWQKLRRKNLIKSLEAGDNLGWQPMLYPLSGSPENSWFTLKDFDKDKYQKLLKVPVYFSRIHDSVVGDMYHLKNYQQAMLGHAYMLTATDGRVIIYGSDEDVSINAGADYKEKVVLAGIKFQQLAGNLPYTDRFENREYCKQCERNDLMFVDRGDAAVAILFSGAEALKLDALTFLSLKKGCYVDLMSGRRIIVDADHVASRNGSKEVTLAPRSAAYIVASECDVREVNASSLK